MNVTRDKFIEIMSDVIREGKFPHFHFCGPHENEVQNVVQSIISPHYKNKSLLLEIHILDNQSESLLIQMITAFCNLQAVVADNANIPKIIIIHQQSEILTESFIHFLEDRMTSIQVKFIFLTASMNVVPIILQNRMVSFTIHPKDKEITTKLSEIDDEDKFYKIINKIEDDDILAEKIISWSQVHCLRMPHVIYEELYERI
jgi:hypothetical protein